MIKVCLVIGLCLFWWLMCYINTGGDERNLRGLRSYPKEVQEMVRNDKTLEEKAPAEANIPKVFTENLILFTVLFLIIGLVLKYTIGFKGFLDIFIYFLTMGESLNLFDLAVIDLLWWRNTKRIRFSFIPDKNLYQDPSMHIGSFVRGLVMYVIIALIVAGVLTLLP
jgi:hypothetical protein